MKQHAVPHATVGHPDSRRRPDAEDRIEYGAARNHQIGTTAANARVKRAFVIRHRREALGYISQVVGFKINPIDPAAVIARQVELERGEWAAAAAQARAAVARAKARVSSVQTLALPTAQAGLKQAEANLVQAERDDKRNRDLLAKGFISQARVDESERQLDVARSQLTSAKAQAGAQGASGAEAQQAQSQQAEAVAALDATEAKLAQTRIRAPAAGVVLERLVEPGDIAQPGRRMMSLALDGPVRLIVQVDEKNLPLIRQGAMAMAAADAFPAERFEAVVNYISPGIDATRGSVELRLDVAKPPALLKSDMTISMDLQGPLLKQALMLPADAVRQLQTEAPWVLVEREGVAVKVTVKVGLQTQGRVAITEGLKAGDRVILNREVEAGSRVRDRR